MNAMSSFDARVARQKFQDFRASVSDWTEKHPNITTGTSMIALALLYFYVLPNTAQLAQDPSLVSIDKAISTIDLGIGLGRETLEGIQFIMHSLSDIVPAGKAPSTIGGAVEFLAEGATIAGLGAGVLKIGANSAKEWWESTFNRAQRMHSGTEPLLERESPSHVLIGDSTIISDIAKKINPDKNKRKPVVGIHPDSGIPPVWGSKIHYHFHAQPHELTDIFTQSKSDMSYIQAVGLDRADVITFACMDADNALFYGNDAQMAVRPSFVTTLLNKITENNKDALNGKKINVIMNDSPQLAEVKAIQDDIMAVGNRARFEPNIISPEALALSVIQENIRKVIDRGSGKKETISITLVGEGNREQDKKMLQRFKKAIAGINMQDGINISVSLVEDTEIDGVKIDGKDITKIKQSETLSDKFSKSDLIYIYGDHDDGTTSLVNNTLSSGVAKDKIHAFIERPNAKYDVEGVYLNPENVHCVYDMVIDAYSA